MTVVVWFNWGVWGFDILFFLIAVEIRKDENWDWFIFEITENRKIEKI